MSSLNQQSKTSGIKCISLNGEDVFDEFVIFNCINNYLLNAVDNFERRNIHNQFNTTNSTLCSKYIKNESRPYSLFLKPESVQEMENTIQSLKGNNAPGIGTVTSALVKKKYIYISKRIREVLTYLVNLSFSGTFPDKLKAALVIPIHKKGFCKDF